MTTAILVVLALTVAYYSVLVEPFRPEHTVVDLDVPGLPAGLDGAKILHVSDVHAARVGFREVWLGDLLERVRPDLLCLTGDLVSSPRGIAPVLEVLARARPSRGCFGVRGNNEVEELTSPNALDEGLARLGVRMLYNEHLILDARRAPGAAAEPAEEAEDRFVVAGVDDPNNGRDDLAAALAGVSGGQDGEGRERGQPWAGGGGEGGGGGGKLFTILLSHTPETFDDAAARGVTLQLSGHTHGGQVRIPGIGALWADTPRTGLRYTGGIYRRGGSTLIVSRGLGWSILPVRIFCRPQVVEIRLHRTARDAPDGIAAKGCMSAEF